MSRESIFARTYVTRSHVPGARFTIIHTPPPEPYRPPGRSTMPGFEGAPNYEFQPAVISPVFGSKIKLPAWRRPLPGPKPPFVPPRGVPPRLLPPRRLPPPTRIPPQLLPPRRLPPPTRFQPPTHVPPRAPTPWWPQRSGLTPPPHRLLTPAGPPGWSVAGARPTLSVTRLPAGFTPPKPASWPPPQALPRTPPTRPPGTPAEHAPPRDREIPPSSPPERTRGRGTIGGFFRRLFGIGETAAERSTPRFLGRGRPQPPPARAKPEAKGKPAVAEPAGGVAPAIGAGEKLPADWTQDHEDLLRLLEAAAGVSAQTPAEDARAVQDALRRWADHPGAAGSREDFLAWVRYLDQHGDDFAAAAGAGGPETRDRLDQLIREGPRAGTGAGSGTPTGSGEGSLLEKFFSGTETLSAAATTALVLALVLTFWFSPSTAWIAFLESQVGRAMLLWMGRAGGVWLSAKIPHTLLHLDNLRRARTEEQRDYWTGVLEEDGRDLAIAAAFAYGGKALGRVPRAEPATEAAPPPRGKASAGKPPDVPPGPEVTPESPPEPEPAIEYPAQRVADLEDRIEALGNEAMMDYLEAIDLSTPEGAAKLAGLEREVSIAEETPAGQPRSGIEPGLSDRATPGGPQPKRYEGGRFTHEYAEPLKRAISPTPGDIPPRFAPQVASGEIIPLDQMPDGLRPEVSLGVTARVDRLGTVIYEIKPNTEASIEAGLTQVQAYARLANAMKLEGRADWTGKVVVYDAAKAKQYVP